MKSKHKMAKGLDDDSFRRLTGVHKITFAEMLKVLKAEKTKIRKTGGAKDKLCVANQLLLSLEYLREYRTYFHLGQSYGVSEATAWRIQRWVEDVLIKSGLFSLPGKKELLKSDVKYEVVLIDASESPIERPKKRRESGIEITGRGTTTLERRSVTL